MAFSSNVCAFLIAFEPGFEKAGKPVFQRQNS